MISRLFFAWVPLLTARQTHSTERATDGDRHKGLCRSRVPLGDWG